VRYELDDQDRHRGAHHDDPSRVAGQREPVGDGDHERSNDIEDG
jgi:hypothetical protein